MGDMVSTLKASLLAQVTRTERYRTAMLMVAQLVHCQLCADGFMFDHPDAKHKTEACGLAVRADKADQ